MGLWSENADFPFSSVEFENISGNLALIHSVEFQDVNVYVMHCRSQAVLSTL